MANTVLAQISLHSPNQWGGAINQPLSGINKTFSDEQHGEAGVLHLPLMSLHLLNSLSSSIKARGRRHIEGFLMLPEMNPMDKRPVVFPWRKFQESWSSCSFSRGTSQTGYQAVFLCGRYCT